MCTYLQRPLTLFLTKNVIDYQRGCCRPLTDSSLHLPLPIQLTKLAAIYPVYWRAYVMRMCLGFRMHCARVAPRIILGGLCSDPSTSTFNRRDRDAYPHYINSTQRSIRSIRRPRSSNREPLCTL